MEGKNRVKDLDPEKYRENTTDFIQVLAGLHFNFTKKKSKKKKIRENTTDLTYVSVLHFDFAKKNSQKKFDPEKFVKIQRIPSMYYTLISRKNWIEK